MKIVYMGTPALAIAPLEALAAEHELLAVVTQPDKPAGRGKEPRQQPVKQWAARRGIPVLQPQRARDEDFVLQIEALAPEAIAVVAFGQILPARVLRAAGKGCINLHYSLLPRWRGAAPVQYALLAGDENTGVTTQWMAQKLDAGDIALTRVVPIEPEETTADLWERLTPIGSEILCETFGLLAQGNLPRRPQNEAEATFAPTLSREDGQLDWSRPAAEIVNRIRATNPWPGAWCPFRSATIKIWRARLGPADITGSPGTVVSAGKTVIVGAADGTVELVEVQVEGRPRLPAPDWCRGARLQPGDRLE